MGERWELRLLMVTIVLCAGHVKTGHSSTSQGLTGSFYLGDCAEYEERVLAQAHDREWLCECLIQD